MSAAGSKILAGAREALAIARGEVEPARVWRRDENGALRNEAGEVWDYDLVHRLRRKADEADNPANWITLTGMSDEEAIATLRGLPSANPRERHRGASAGTDTLNEASTTASPSPKAETR